MENLNIGGRSVGPGTVPYIVAEIGANHNGDMDLCRRMIDAAKAAGADAVKFQSWTKTSLISKPEYARNTVYSTGGKPLPSLEQAVERYQLSVEQHREISRYCQEQDITFFSSCFSIREVDLLESLDVPAYKIASMDVNHHPLLEYVASRGKPIILSTGLATLGEIERALEILKKAGPPQVMLLHCVSLYPSPPESVNLRNMGTLRQAFDVPVGYSDHTLGTAVPLAAIALGASLIEKHFTLDKTLEGWDHAISADPAEMRALVDGARAISAAMGSPVRTITDAQKEKRKAFRRRMIATRDLKKGARLTLADVDFKRPGTGINPDELCYAVGRPLSRDIMAEEEFEWADLG